MESRPIKPESQPSPDGLGKIKLRAFDARNTQWVSLKQRPTQFGDNKHGAHTKDWPTEEEKKELDKVALGTKELLPETIQAFVDKHAISVLDTNELGREFVKQLNAKANIVVGDGFKIEHGIATEIETKEVTDERA